MASTTFTTNHLTPHEAISDAAIRLVQALDDRSPELLASSLTEDASYDLRPFSFLADFGLLVGRENIVTKLLNAVGDKDTTHMLSNFRTQLSEDGKTAKLTCYALAQHWRPGQGQSWVFGNCYLMGNRYDGELVKGDDGLWRFKTFVIACTWSQGDAAVMSKSDQQKTEESVRKTASQFAA
ncbi:hypothetical protein HII31_00113 [Pseudocercospora fuligena]|uniref:SnoaL-like domain-containing protein n=1 Tax=Pseudocercospora fuligena TaxID=685502 RepID=A0A8H6VRY4_9PEZI|nr:hypothetical protein HII31_00113 [Pseudocercospora fuligena]